MRSGAARSRIGQIAESNAEKTVRYLNSHIFVGARGCWVPFGSCGDNRSYLLGFKHSCGLVDSLGQHRMGKSGFSQSVGVKSPLDRQRQRRDKLGGIHA